MTRQTIAIHQPEYFPWLGFLDKARQVDTLVLLDSVQFDRSSLQHRAKIVSGTEVTWLTIPFKHKFPQRIDEVLFADSRWSTKHQKTLQAAYGKAPGFRDAAPQLSAYFEAQHPRFVDATIASCELLLDVFGVRPPEVLRSSELGVSGEKAELVLDICAKLDAKRYVSGKTGAGYLRDSAFPDSGIELVVQDFSLPNYSRRQTLPEDARGISALDAWLEVGATCSNLLGARA